LLQAGVSAALLKMAGPPREVSYERKRVVGELGLPSQPVRSTWTAVPGAAHHYDVMTGVDEPDTTKVAQRYRYGQDGLVVVAEGPLEAEGPALEPWVPPLVVLPEGARPGQAWESAHVHAGETVVRTCEIMGNDTCADGVIVVCDRTQGDLRVVVRDRFCPGTGWVGYESLVVRPGSPAVRTWTEGLRRVD
jgi:hypothetical protein